MVNLSNLLPLGLVSFAILVRWLVAQFPHSGQSTPPLYGDYEAQRHWMEVTNNLPVEDWYKNTTDNDLLYWGLDYPPLTAYHMFILGYVSKHLINGTWTELHKSRGTEDYEHKIYMRASVIVADLLIYMPAIVYYFYKTTPINFNSPPSTIHKLNIVTYTSLVLLNPSQVLIDHGHFQYNCVFMGLVLWAIIFMCKGKQYISALLFTLALCYKQMSLYYSLPFFWYIASYNLRVRPFWKGLRNIVVVGLIVISTFVIIFLPFLQDKRSILAVVERIFPFSRGLFEDKVANLWFTLSVFYKFRQLYSIDELLKFSTLMTLVASLPAGLHLLFKPNIRSFKYALVNTSMVFFLLSFQVHEKTILVPALPILLLYREHPMAVNWFVVISTFSLQPLLIKDGQTIPYFVSMIMFTLMTLDFFRQHIALSLDRILTVKNLFIVIYLASILNCFIMSFAALLITPPSRYPHLHPTINAIYSCGHFVGFLLFFYYNQFVNRTKHLSSTDRIYLTKKTK